MSLFSRSSSTKRYGVILDIGSGSVLAAIVLSDKSEQKPYIVWSHRERAPLKNIDSLEQSAKAVTTALVNCSMVLETEGRKALGEYDSSAKLTDLQCTISAPWAYTVTKSINFKQEEEFQITDELIEELEETIEKKVREDLKQNTTLSELGLDIVSELTMDVSANGYHVQEASGNKALEISIAQASTVIPEYLISAIDELKEKLFSNTEVTKVSFATVLYLVSKEIAMQSQELCLVDITFEATEIGIVRDGILTYCTHIPFGSYSIAREIAEITGVPLAEAFGYLHTEEPLAFTKQLTTAKQTEVQEMIDSYIEKVSNLFHETGDSLSIPSSISLHADLQGELFFRDLIRAASKKAIKIDPHITPITTEILGQFYSKKDSKTPIPTDTALMLSAQFFHMQPAHDAIEHF